MSIVPGDVQRDLPLQGSAIVGNKQPPRALLLDRLHESLDHGDTSMLADGAEALRNASAATPLPEPTTLELLASVCHKMPRRDFGFAGRALNEKAHSLGGRLLREVPEADDASGVVIDGDSEPPAEGPALWKSGNSSPRPVWR